MTDIVLAHNCCHLLSLPDPVLLDGQSPIWQPVGVQMQRREFSLPPCPPQTWGRYTQANESALKTSTNSSPVQSQYSKLLYLRELYLEPWVPLLHIIASGKSFLPSVPKQKKKQFGLKRKDYWISWELSELEFK